MLHLPLSPGRGRSSTALRPMPSSDASYRGVDGPSSLNGYGKSSASRCESRAICRSNRQGSAAGDKLAVVASATSKRQFDRSKTLRPGNGASHQCQRIAPKRVESKSFEGNAYFRKSSTWMEIENFVAIFSRNETGSAVELAVASPGLFKSLYSRQ